MQVHDKKAERLTLCSAFSAFVFVRLFVGLEGRALKCDVLVDERH